MILIAGNDRPFARDCLDSIWAQGAPIHELIVVDCDSIDGTVHLVAATGCPTRVVSGMTPKNAFDTALASATGEFVVVMTCGERYAPDSLRLIVERLQRGGTVVAGRAHAVGTTNFGRAAAAVAAVLPACRPTPVAWERAGHAGAPRVRRVDVDEAIRSWRYAPESAWRLATENFRAGADAAAREVDVREIPPLVACSGLLVVATVLVGILSGGRRRAVVPAAHLAACLGLAAWAGRSPGVAPHRALLAIEVGHWASGAGLLGGLARPRRTSRGSTPA